MCHCPLKARQYIRQLVKKEARQGDSSGEEEDMTVLARGIDFFRRITVNTSANYKSDKDKDKD